MTKNVMVMGEMDEDGVVVPAPRGQVGDARYDLDVAILKYVHGENVRTATSDDG